MCYYLCSDNVNKDMVHGLASCAVYSDIRNRIVGEMRMACEEAIPSFTEEEIFSNLTLMTQFILDCTSINFPKINQECDLLAIVLSR